MKVIINTNEQLHVRLSEYGQKLYRDAWNASFERMKGETPDVPVSDNYGFYTFQLWEFMAYFGAAMYNGNPDIVAEQNLIEFRKEL